MSIAKELASTVNAFFPLRTNCFKYLLYLLCGSVSLGNTWHQQSTTYRSNPNIHMMFRRPCVPVNFPACDHCFMPGLSPPSGRLPENNTRPFLTCPSKRGTFLLSTVREPGRMFKRPASSHECTCPNSCRIAQTNTFSALHTAGTWSLNCTGSIKNNSVIFRFAFHNLFGLVQKDAPL